MALGESPQGGDGIGAAAQDDGSGPLEIGPGVSKLGRFRRSTRRHRLGEKIEDHMALPETRQARFAPVSARQAKIRRRISRFQLLAREHEANVIEFPPPTQVRSIFTLLQVCGDHFLSDPRLNIQGHPVRALGAIHNAYHWREHIIKGHPELGPYAGEGLKPLLTILGGIRLPFAPHRDRNTYK